MIHSHSIHTTHTCCCSCILLHSHSEMSLKSTATGYRYRSRRCRSIPFQSMCIPWNLYAFAAVTHRTENSSMLQLSSHQETRVDTLTGAEMGSPLKHATQFWGSAILSVHEVDIWHFDSLSLHSYDKHVPSAPSTHGAWPSVDEIVHS